MRPTGEAEGGESVQSVQSGKAAGERTAVEEGRGVDGGLKELRVGERIEVV